MLKSFPILKMNGARFVEKKMLKITKIIKDYQGSNALNMQFFKTNCVTLQVMKKNLKKK